MHVDHLERNTAYMVSMMQFYNGEASSSTAPTQPPPAFQLPVLPPIAPAPQTTPTEDHFLDDDQSAL